METNLLKQLLVPHYSYVRPALRGTRFESMGNHTGGDQGVSSGAGAEAYANVGAGDRKSGI